VDFEPVEAQNAFHGNDGPEPKKFSAPYAIFGGEPRLLGESRGVDGPLKSKTYIGGMIDEVGLWARGLSQEEVRDAGENLPAFLGVSLRGKLATSWASLKASR